MIGRTFDGLTMVEPATVERLLAQLQELSEMPLRDEIDLRKWQDASGELQRWISSADPALADAVPHFVWHYLADADVRIRDDVYRREQEEEWQRALRELSKQPVEQSREDGSGFARPLTRRTLDGLRMTQRREETNMDIDDGRRSTHGVVACLVECPDGRTKLVLDDVSGDAEKNPVRWSFAWFYTHNRYDSAALKDGLSDEEYRLIGENLVFRLLALEGQVR